MSVGLNHYLIVCGILFAIGFFGVLLRKNVIFIFMCIEIMLTAVNGMLIAFSKFNGVGDGLVFVFFTITVAAAEVAIGLAIIVALFKKRQTVMVDEINQLKN